MGCFFLGAAFFYVSLYGFTHVMGDRGDSGIVRFYESREKRENNLRNGDCGTVGIAHPE